jgi:competence protein ComEA
VTLISALTPEERRGAITIVVLLMLGAAHDLWRVRHPLIAPPLPPAPATDTTLRVGRPPADTTTASAPAGLDLNRATAGELDRLPGIGPVLAARIVAERSRRGGFRAPEDLLAVPGIGPRLYARLRSRVRVGS